MSTFQRKNCPTFLVTQASEAKVAWNIVGHVSTPKQLYAAGFQLEDYHCLQSGAAIVSTWICLHGRPRRLATFDRHS